MDLAWLSAAAIRAQAAAGLAFLGVELDAARNDRAGDAVIGAAGARVRIVAVSAREDLKTARQARALRRR